MIRVWKAFWHLRNRIFLVEYYCSTLYRRTNPCCFNLVSIFWLAGIGHEWPSRPEAEGTLGHGLVQDLRVL